MPAPRRSRAQRPSLLLGFAALLLALIAIGAGAALLLGRGNEPAKPAVGQAVTAVPHSRVHRRVGPLPPRFLVVRRRGRLTDPVQDAAAAPIDRGHVLLLGGLTPLDVSTAAIVKASAVGGRLAGSLPGALHDAAAATLGRAVYLFGGGNGVGQLSDIVRVDGAGGTRVVSRLPAPSSDQAAAAIDGTAYVVGGFTGTRWLSTIVAWRPGSPARVVARLPTPVRYAAVAAVGDRLIVAGGSLPDGSASRSVFAYEPGKKRVWRLARLPKATTHAGAAALAGTAYIVGGRGAVLGTARRQILGIDAHSGRIRVAGRLPAALSDLAVTTLGRRILVAGGRGARGTVSSLLELAAGSSAARTTARLAVRRRAGTSRRTRSGAATDVYAADRAGMLSPAVRGALPRVYVPNSLSNSVDVIDPRTYRVVGQFAVGALPQHVTPAWNLRKLYVLNDIGNSLTPIDPRTAKPGSPIPVEDPYNMYFTPDGRFAIVVAERLHRLDFRSGARFRLQHSLPLPCVGVDHMDFSADGSYLIASCEFSGQMVKVDVERQKVVATLTLPDGARGMPQDVKVSPDGSTFYVADMHANGLWKLDGDAFRVKGFLPTGAGAHGLYPSRDARFLYATNRGEGTISVISFATEHVVARWRIPGGSPDMGGVSADGRVLWLSGRYNGEVYALSTRTGKLLARIPVGGGPHGLSVWPQPGRYSLGHTGVLR